MSWAQRVDDSVHEAELRAEARREAVRNLVGYIPLLNRIITPAQLAEMRDSNTSEGAGTPGNLVPREHDANAT